VLVVPVVALTERSSNLLGVPVVKVFFEQLLGSLLKVFLVHLWGRGGYHIGLLCVCVCVCVCVCAICRKKNSTHVKFVKKWMRKHLAS